MAGGERSASCSFECAIFTRVISQGYPSRICRCRFAFRARRMHAFVVASATRSFRRRDTRKARQNKASAQRTPVAARSVYWKGQHEAEAKRLEEARYVAEARRAEEARIAEARRLDELRQLLDKNKGAGDALAPHRKGSDAEEAERRETLKKFTDGFLTGSRERPIGAYRSVTPPSPSPHQPGDIESKRIEVAATVRVFFGSDRNLTGSTDPERFYGYQRASTSFGYSDVTIPLNHKMGNLESPLDLVVWKGSPDPKWHIVVSSISSLAAADFFNRLHAQTVDQNRSRQAFVFVHGYATTFHDALRRAAQMKYDLQFPGTAILYSWPSSGDERTYGADEDSIAWSAANMREFLRVVAEKSGAEEIFLIAHSMGTRGLATAISAIASTADRGVSSRYKQVILAAPDIDRDIFKDQILPAVRTAGMALTVYASDRDKALDLSRIGHSYPRLGSTSPTPGDHPEDGRARGAAQSWLLNFASH